jgi:Carboxypeptidase regulatory-like domain/TonB dependent receptor
MRTNSRRKGARSSLWTFGVLIFSGCILTASASVAQSTSSSTIHGTVKDDTGGTLPGVTVTIASPSLQVGRMVTVTGSDGNYRFVDLPAGSYNARFELPGFGTYNREDLRVTVGFIARVDVVLKVGALEESVTVSGQSPVVDASSTSASVAFTRETLEALPRGRDVQNILAMAPGVTQAVPDVGGSTMAQRQNISSYGVSSQPKLQVEGMTVSMGADGNSAIYFMTDTIEEVQVKSSGNDAEVSVPGISMVGVLKSGGNDFHGSYTAAFQSPSLQSNNLDAALQAQGVRATAPLSNFYDYSADLGGRIVRDKLWFYAATSRQSKAQGILGFVSSPGPDGRYLTGDEPPTDNEVSLAQFAAKISYQMSKNNRLIYAQQIGTKREPQNGSGRFVPLEATRDYVNPGSVWKGELQSAFNSRTLLNVVGGYTGYLTDYDAGRSYARADAPPRRDLETTLATGSHPLHQEKTRDRYQVDGSISFFPDREVIGKHELKTGAMVYIDRTTDGYLNNLAGNYILQTDRIGGVSGTPTRIEMRNTPVAPLGAEDTYAFFVKDAWRLNNRVTLNLGARWERQHSFVPAQSREAARDFPQLFPAGTFPRKEVGTWSRTVPRIGVAWDVDGKSVVKASAGAYNYMFGDTFGDAYNPNATGTATFAWHDLNGDKLYQPGEVNLNPQGPDFITTTAASSAMINQNLRQPTTWEGTVSYERELAANFGIRAMYIDRTLVDYFSTPGPNIKRPYSVYNIPITRRDPGPDGLLNSPDDAGSVTFYDYDPAYRGAAFVGTQLTNSANEDRFRTMEFTVTRRYSGRWMAQASYFAVKNHRVIERTINSPNDEFFNLDEVWNWGTTVTGSYHFPYDITFAGFLHSKSGVAGQRTNIFRQADPDGGTPIAQLNNVTLRLEPYGTRRLATINILNLRLGKDFRLGGSKRLAVEIDVYNALNSNAPLSATFASGPTFSYVTDVLPPRIARIGARFRF